MMIDERIDELNTANALSRGAIATIWGYSASLNQLTIRITWPGSRENMHLICNACERIEMSPSWTNVDFMFHECEDGLYRLEDATAHFFVDCAMIRVFREVEPIYMAI